MYTEQKMLVNNFIAKKILNLETKHADGIKLEKTMKTENGEYKADSVNLKFNLKLKKCSTFRLPYVKNTYPFTYIVDHILTLGEFKLLDGWMEINKLTLKEDEINNFPSLRIEEYEGNHIMVSEEDLKEVIEHDKSSLKYYYVYVGNEKVLISLEDIELTFNYSPYSSQPFSITLGLPNPLNTKNIFSIALGTPKPLNTENKGKYNSKYEEDYRNLYKLLKDNHYLIMDNSVGNTLTSNTTDILLQLEFKDRLLNQEALEILNEDFINIIIKSFIGEIL